MRSVIFWEIVIAFYSYLVAKPFGENNSSFQNFKRFLSIFFFLSCVNWQFDALNKKCAQLESSFDGRGNYTLGVKEHIIFPEIDFDKIDKIKGLDITITTSAKNNQEAAPPSLR